MLVLICNHPQFRFANKVCLPRPARLRFSVSLQLSQRGLYMVRKLQMWLMYMLHITGTPDPSVTLLQLPTCCGSSSPTQHCIG